jgi:hypothetical protein
MDKWRNKKKNRRKGDLSSIHIDSGQKPCKPRKNRTNHRQAGAPVDVAIGCPMHKQQ